MANLSIRKLDDKIYNQLRSRASQHGVSMEEEVRSILTQAVLPSKKLREIFKTHFGEDNGIDLVLPKRDKH